MAKYTCTITIDAFRWTCDDNQSEDPGWFVSALKSGIAVMAYPHIILYVNGLETTVNVGDYIVRGITGLIFPVEFNKFNNIYKLVNTDEDIINS